VVPTSGARLLILFVILVGVALTFPV
jgi:hypothetical protein